MNLEISMGKTIFSVFLILGGCATLRRPIYGERDGSSQCDVQCIEFWPRGSMEKSWLANSYPKLVENVLSNEVVCADAGICSDEDRIIVFEDESGFRHTYSSYARLYAMARAYDDWPSYEWRDEKLVDLFRFAKKTVVSFAQSRPWVVSRGDECNARRLSVRIGESYSSGNHRIDPPWFGFTNIVFSCGLDGRLDFAFSTREEPASDHALMFALCDQMAIALAEEFCIKDRVVKSEKGMVLIIGEEGGLCYRVAASCNERLNKSHLYMRVGKSGSSVSLGCL